MGARTGLNCGLICHVRRRSLGPSAHHQQAPCLVANHRGRGLTDLESALEPDRGAAEATAATVVIMVRKSLLKLVQFVSTMLYVLMAV
jgi:hypothetical protein